jgi:hypothetical protein
VFYENIQNQALPGFYFIYFTGSVFTRNNDFFFLLNFLSLLCVFFSETPNQTDKFSAQAILIFRGYLNKKKNNNNKKKLNSFEQKVISSVIFHIHIAVS